MHPGNEAEEGMGEEGWFRHVVANRYMADAASGFELEFATRYYDASRFLYDNSGSLFTYFRFNLGTHWSPRRYGTSASARMDNAHKTISVSEPICILDYPEYPDLMEAILDLSTACDSRVVQDNCLLVNVLITDTRFIPL